MAELTDESPLEEDWEILRRIPEAERFTTTIDMAEAIERICKAVVDYTILVGDKSKHELRMKNLYPVFTIIPYWDNLLEKHLWKAHLLYEEINIKYMTTPYERCEQAVEALFNTISESIQTKAQEFAANGDKAEQEANDYRDAMRKLRRIGTGMGRYDITQPNLPLLETK